MKRIYTILMAAAVVAACAEKPQMDAPKGEHDGNLVKMTFSAAVDDNLDVPQVKTTYSGRNVFWEEDDAITVFFEGDEITRQQFVEAGLFDGNRLASFEGLGDADAAGYIAVYPDAESNAYDGTNVKVTIPSEQTAVANGFASGANVAVACSSDASLKFRNVGSLIAFRFETAEDAARTASVTFRAKTETEGEYLGIAGEATVAIEEQQPEADSGEPVKYIPVVSGEGAADYVTLQAPEGGFESGTNKTYYAVIYPGDYAHGFEVTFTTNDETPAEFKLNNDLAQELPRNVLLSMGALPNPYDTLPDEITISLDFYGSNWPFKEDVLTPANQSVEGDVYTYVYAGTTDGNPVDLTFVICKGPDAGANYVHSTFSQTEGNKVLAFQSGVNSWIKLPGIRGRYLKSVSMGTMNSGMKKRFRLQVGTDASASAYYNSPLVAASSYTEAAATKIVFPTTDTSMGPLKTTQSGNSYVMFFTAGGGGANAWTPKNMRVGNITLVYTKQAPVAAATE